MSLVACTLIGSTPQLDPDKAARIRVHISDFRKRKEKRGEYFDTETMMAHGYPWKIRIYPRGDHETNADWVSCYLIYDSDAYDREEFPVDAKAIIRSNISSAPPKSISINTYNGEYPGMGFSNWAQRNYACNMGCNGGCNGGIITIDVDICVDKKRKSVWYPTKAIKDTTDSKLERLLCNSSKLSDVTFIVGSKKRKFNGHKCILEMSSPYLYGLVLSKAEEIDDIDTAAATSETAEQKKSEQEGISSEGFVPVSSVEDNEYDDKDDEEEEDNEDAPVRSTKNLPSSFSPSAPCPPKIPFGTAANSVTGSTTTNNDPFASSKMVFGGGGGSTSMANAPSSFSTFSTSSKPLFGTTSASPPNVDIELPGVSEVAFYAVVKFLYTGTEPKYLRRDENSAKDVLLLADKFDCTHLKLYTESVLAERFLDNSNAADMILFADAHSCALLKEAAMAMYATDPKTVKKTEGYSKLMESKDLVIELLEYTNGERGECIRVADRTPEENVDNLDVTSLRERLQSVGIRNVDGSKDMLVKRWKDTIL
jgi:hypothetical protein